MGFVGLGVCVFYCVLFLWGCWVVVWLVLCFCDGVLCGLWLVCGWVYVFGVILVC